MVPAFRDDLQQIVPTGIGEDVLFLFFLAFTRWHWVSIFGFNFIGRPQICFDAKHKLMGPPSSAKLFVQNRRAYQFVFCTKTKLRPASNSTSNWYRILP